MCQNYVCQDGEPVYLYVYLGVPPAEDGRGGRARMDVCISGCAAAEADAEAGHACMYMGVPPVECGRRGRARPRRITVSYITSAIHT